LRTLIAFLLLSATGAMAQSTHSVDLSWTASIDAAANPSGTYIIYRAPVPCTPAPAATAFVKVGSAIASLTKFTDPVVPLGPFCYAVTFSVNGAESLQSNLTPAVVLPAAPVLGPAVVH
jgi:hypothetical protein